MELGWPEIPESLLCVLTGDKPTEMEEGEFPKMAIKELPLYQGF